MAGRSFALVVICLFAAMIVGCSYAPKPEAAAVADYGTPMTASDMQSAADKYLTRVLKDPDSRRVEWGRSGKVWVWAGLVGGGQKYGYGLEGLVNAKNSFGGYTGSKPYLFYFRDGNLLWANEMLSSDAYGFVP